MKKLLMMLIGATLLTGLSGEATAEVFKFKSEGLRVEGYVRNSAGDTGSISLFKNEYGGYWAQVVLTRRSPGDSTFGSGQLPESAVTITSKGVQIQFDSRDLPEGSFSTYRDMPLSVSIQVSPNGLRTERNTGNSMVRNPWLQLHINGITEVESADLFGSINDLSFPEEYAGQGSLGTSKGITILVENNNQND
jgi:hypothetical protein